MNATLILGAVALAGLAMVAMKPQEVEVEADEPVIYMPDILTGPISEITGDVPVEPTPEIITEPPPAGPPGGQYQLVPVGDLSIELIGG